MTERTAGLVGLPDDAIPRRAWWSLSVSTLVVFLVVIDISAVNVAFPSIRRDFDVTDSELSWVIGAYNVVVGALLMVSGRLADSLGRRRVYLPGVAIFGLGSMLCALAPGAGWLIGARVVQGVGGSVTMAAGYAVMLPDFPPTRRGTAIGFAGATGALGAVVGPVAGSFLIDLFSWRAIFWLNVPLCALVLIVGPRLLSESRDPSATGRVDLGGVAIGTVGVAAVMFAIVQSESWGIGDPLVVALLVGGMALGFVLVRRSRVHPEPLLDLTLFRYRSFRSANIGLVFYGLAFGSGFLANSLLLQDVWGLGVREVGLAFAPSPLLASVISPITGRWADRIGHRWLLSVGCGACGVAFAAYALVLDGQPAVWDRYVPISLLLGIGIGLTVATWSSAGISDIPPSKFGVAGATYNTLRQAAMGLGVAVVVTLIAAGGEVTTFTGIRHAYVFIVVSYVAAAVAVALTFPPGSARDRAGV